MHMDQAPRCKLYVQYVVQYRSMARRFQEWWLPTRHILDGREPESISRCRPCVGCSGPFSTASPSCREVLDAYAPTCVNLLHTLRILQIDWHLQLIREG